MALPFRPFRIARNTPLAEGIFELVLEPADGQPVAPFAAGQWIGIRQSNEDMTRKIAAFSIASAPYESTEGYVLTIKAYGERTTALQRSSPGDVVNVQGPYGAFVLRPGVSRLVFLAGGVGITPLRSMIRQSLHVDGDRELVLFYSNQSRATTAYDQEFRDLAKAHPHFTYIPVLTRETPEGWDGETRRVDADMLRTRLGDVRPDDEFLMCGPEPLMDAVKAGLTELGIDIKTRMRRESFA
jgi:ferredoxin-NADP reductase